MGSGPRVIRADREQLYWDMIDLDSLIEPDHLARVVWVFVEGLDLSALYDRIKARDEVAGRPTPDPKVQLALWLYAVLNGVGSARALARLCREHVAYRWLCGGVPVNYHGLSDFRTLDAALLDRVLSESVAVLAAEGLVDLDEVAVDGTKLQASAGKGSFRRDEDLGRWEQAAQRRIARLQEEAESDPGATDRRQRAARDRAAASVGERASAARRKLAELQAEKAAREKTHKKQEKAKSPPAASTTDPQARMMKLPDGSVRPAYNLLLALAPEAMVIVGLEPTDRRNDSGLATPMIEQLEGRYGARPQRLLVDTNLATQEEIVALAEHPEQPVRVYAPLPAEKENVTAQTARKRARKRAREPEALKAWRQRMASRAGQLLYRRRRVIETVNGQLKNCGLRQLRLRGIEKVRCEALLYAIAHNVRRGHALRLAAAGA